MKIETEEISIPIVKQKKVRLFIKRIDKAHPFVSGNKWYKLKYNLIKAKEKGFKTFLTFGGAYSNHIAATAFAAQEKGFKSIGIIRGEEHLPLNSTLRFARENGMELHYVSRSDYRQKATQDFIRNLRNRFGDFYLLPEGGTNDLAIKGTAEILDANDTQDYICCAVGTGGTIAGIINASDNKQKIIGFPAIKGSDTLQKEIESWTKKQNWKLINNYVCGGYAKVNIELVSFIHQFNLAHNILLDAVYTGKMMFGILNLIEQDYFPKGISILAIHTGGLQGNKGINERFGLDLITE
jgi:1-aminocyclopropane-1-carboxylate deaminase